MAGNFKPAQLKSPPDFKLCESCEKNLLGTSMRPNESVVLQCVTCLASERIALLNERSAALEYIGWLKVEVKVRDGELAEKDATIASLEAKMAHLTCEMKAAIAKTPVEFRTPEPKATYLGPMVIVAMDRQCAEFCPGKLKLHRLLANHRGLKTRLYPVSSLAGLCSKVKHELEKEGASDYNSVILWGGLGICQDASYHRERAVNEAKEALEQLEQHPKINKLIYATASADARNYEHQAFEDRLLSKLPAGVERIDMRYISQRPTLTSEGAWNLAGMVEACVRLCRQVGALLNVSPLEIDQSLTEAFKKSRDPVTEDNRQEGQERVSETSQPPKVQASARGSQVEIPSTSDKAAHGPRDRKDVQKPFAKPFPKGRGAKKRNAADTSMESIGKEQKKQKPQTSKSGASGSASAKGSRPPAQQPSTSTPMKGNEEDDKIARLVKEAIHRDG